MLELLGPRWRRDARLPVVETAVAGRPLTPAVFTEGAAGKGASTPAEAAGALDGDRAGPGAESPPQHAAPTLHGVMTPDSVLPVAPPIPVPGGRPTIHRLARRHDLEEAGPPAPARAPLRRGLAIAAVLSTLAVAIVIGALVGSGHRSPAAVRKRTPTLSPATQATQAVAVLKDVGAARDKGLRRLRAAHSTAAYVTAATDVERAYQAGVRQFARLPAATQAGTQARAIDATLGRLAGLYGSLAAAAEGPRANARVAGARARIAPAERSFRDEIEALR